MKWKELSFNEPNTKLVRSGPVPLVFQDGTEVHVRYYYDIVRSEWYGHAVLSVPEREELDLLDGVDDGQTSSHPRLFAIFGDAPSEVFLFGGPFAFRLSSALTIHETIELYRARDMEEYWYVHFEDSDLGLVIIYEEGAFLLDRKLKVKWHINKAVNDFFDRMEDSRLAFLGDRVKKWWVSLADGSITGPYEHR